MTVLASIVVLLEVLTKVFKLNINLEAVISICVAVIGVLVTLGLVSKDKTDKTITNKNELTDLLKENEETSKENNKKTIEKENNDTNENIEEDNKTI